jgi:hypothetical protein
VTSISTFGIAIPFVEIYFLFRITYFPIDEQVYSCFLTQRSLRYSIEIKFLREDFCMKFSKTAMGLFTLFLLCSASIKASSSDGLINLISYIVHHPFKTVVMTGKISTEGCVTAYAAYLSALRFAKCYKYFETNRFKLDFKFLQKPFKTALIGVGLAFVMYECGNNLINDVKSL